MPNQKIQSLTVQGVTYDIVDNTSGYSTFSGNYNDLTNKPTIPTVPTQLVGTTLNTTPTQVAAALANNQNIEIQHTDSTYGTYKFYDFIYDAIYGNVVASIIAKWGTSWLSFELAGHTADDSWNTYVTTLAEVSNIPTKVSELTNDSGYTTNTGTITRVKTTAGAHTVIDVSSGAANFNVPTKTSHLTNDSGFITGYTETDPIFSASAAAGITSTDITNWNNKSDFSGSYDDLTDKPTIPTVPTNVSAFTNDAGYLTSYTETDPTVPSWAKASTKPSYNFSEIGSTPTTLSGYGITNAYTKTEVDGLVAGVLHYKGTKASVANLPSTGNVTGDVWHITADGSEYAWDGSIWQELGTAIDLSDYLTEDDLPDNTGLSVTGLSIADHPTASIYGVGSTTTSVTGVQATTTSVTGVQSTTTAVRGVKTGTSSTTTASHVSSGGNGTAPTLGDPISVYGVQSGTTSVRGVKTGTNSTTTASKVTFGTAFSVPNPSFSDITVPIRADADVTVPVAASSATTVPIKNTSATTVPTAASSATSCDDITDWNAGGGALTFTMDTTDTKKLIISHTHTVPSLSYTARSITGVSGSTSIYGVQSTTTSVTGVSGSTTVRGVKTGTSSTTTASKATLGTAFSIPNPSASDITVPIRADADTTVPIKNASATAIPNVTSVGSASNWVFEDVTVPIRADADTTVPIKATSATTVPIKDIAATTVPVKNGTATTVVTSGVHDITDNGHTHTI